MEVFVLTNDNRGRVVVEAKAGANQNQPGLLLSPANACFDRPSMQMQADRDMGDGSTIPCNPDPPFDYCVGGVPGGLPLFDGSDAVTRAMNKMACRFRVVTLCNPSVCEACTQDSNGLFNYLGQGTKVQYCGDIPQEAGFPSGDTVLSVEVLDGAGTVGETKQIKVRAP